MPNNRTDKNIKSIALAYGSNPSAAAAGNTTYVYANRAGIPWVAAGHPNIVTYRATYTAAQTDSAIVSVGTGSQIAVTGCTVVADKANTADVAVRIGFGSSS